MKVLGKIQRKNWKLWLLKARDNFQSNIEINLDHDSFLKEFVELLKKFKFNEKLILFPDPEFVPFWSYEFRKKMNIPPEASIVVENLVEFEEFTGKIFVMKSLPAEQYFIVPYNKKWIVVKH